MPRPAAGTAPAPAKAPKGAQALEAIRREILTGRLPGGARLRQIPLAEALGFSQIPIREAILQLETEGLVTLLPFAGAVVTQPTPEGVLQATRVRVLLECEALALAMPNHTRDTLRAARERLNQARKGRDAYEHFNHYQAFLEALYAPCMNPLLVQEILRIFRASQPVLPFQARIVASLTPGTMLPHQILDLLDAGRLVEAQENLRLLYRQAAIHAAAYLHEPHLLPTAPRKAGTRD